MVGVQRLRVCGHGGRRRNPEALTMTGSDGSRFDPQLPLSSCRSLGFWLLGPVRSALSRCLWNHSASNLCSRVSE